MITNADIQKRFVYHPPHGDQPERYTAIRQAAGELASFILARTPESREQTLAIGKIEEAVFWANAAIARNEHK